eukprot:m.35032 g.35032  ORF g.35032 m.35032 type:complete len:59 (+) comp9841_c0_seq3:1560-1736(+)
MHWLFKRHSVPSTLSQNRVMNNSHGLLQLNVPSHLNKGVAVVIDNAVIVNALIVTVAS